MPEIGDTVYQFDINHRVYARDAAGRAQGGPIYREYFRPYVITGTDKRSWLVSAPGSDRQFKVSKDKVLTSGQMDEQCWVEDHRIKVVRLVDQCRDPAVLKSVAALLGYAPPADL